MAWYGEHVLPHLIHVACGTAEVGELRSAVVPLATGRVLEIGMGSGLNLPYYSRDQIEWVWGLEPSAGMRSKAHSAIDASGLDVRRRSGAAWALRNGDDQHTIGRFRLQRVEVDGRSHCQTRAATADPIRSMKLSA